MQYPVNEIFQTIQGEGAFTGVPSIFIRLQGCPVGCAWCDTKHTWTLDDAFQLKPEQTTELVEKTADDEKWSQLSALALIEIIKQKGYTATHIVITGGEPCLYDLTALTDELHNQGFKTQIETSGTFEVKTNDNTFVTVSPKVAMKGGYEVLESALLRADEIKHPVATQNHIDDLDGLLAGLPAEYQQRVCLQPISQKQRATELATKVCIERNWRLSIQTHKYLGIA